MLKNIITITTIISLCLLVVILNTTTPTSAGPLGILLLFIFSYVLSLGVMAFFVYWASFLVSRVSSLFMTRKPIVPLSFKKSYYYSTVLAVAPILMVGLQSVGSVGFYEILLVVIFLAVGCLFVSKKVQ